MAVLTQKKPSKAKSRSIAKSEIARRLIDLDIAQTSVIRDLEMDVNGEAGLDSRSVILKARKLIQ